MNFTNTRFRANPKVSTSVGIFEDPNRAGFFLLFNNERATHKVRIGHTPKLVASRIVLKSLLPLYSGGMNLYKGVAFALGTQRSGL